MPKEGISSFSRTGDLSQLIREATTLTHCVSAAKHRSAVECLMRLALPHIELDDFSGTEINSHGYGRKILYAAPEGRFTVLQIKWMPGACTPIHGHNAWGCVGVVSGELGCDMFDLKPGASVDMLENAIAPAGSIVARRGDVAAVESNPKGIHRLFNPTGEQASSLHIYGMDLSENPCAINVPYELTRHN